MKIFFSLILLLSNVMLCRAQEFHPSDTDSKVHFVIKNFGIKTGGDFSNIAGTIIFDTANVAASSFDVTVDAATIDTDNGLRDKSLREEYFEVNKYPRIRLTSTRIAKTNKTSEGFYYFTGNLTIRDVTREISFPFRAEKSGANYIFSGEFVINRLDYKVGSKSTVLSNNVVVTLNVSAKKK